MIATYITSEYHLETIHLGINWYLCGIHLNTVWVPCLDQMNTSWSSHEYQVVLEYRQRSVISHKHHLDTKW